MVQVQKGNYGAETIEELRTTYLKAHQAKNMKQFRHMLLVNVGRLNSDHSRPWYTGVTHPNEVAMEKLFKIPIKDVEFIAGPGPQSEYGRECGFYRQNEVNKEKKKRIMHLAKQV